MDWDGVGTFAFFIATGGIGLGLVALRAVKAQLAWKLEMERLRRSNAPPDEVLEQMRALETQVQRLTERVDFTERLIGDGRSDPSETESAV